MNYIIIDSREKEEMLALVKNNKLVEFFVEEKKDRKIFGNIYRARVERIVPGIDAAFVDIGREKNGYLHISQVHREGPRDKSKVHKIDEILKEGQEIIVQVTKGEIGSKGAKLSSYIELKGRYMVLTPYDQTIAISRKIDRDKRDKLLKDLKAIVREDVGLVLRTAGGDVGLDKLIDEYNTLFQDYEKIERERNFLPCPKLIYTSGDLGYQVIRDIFDDSIDKILVNNRDYYEDLLLMEKKSPFKFSHKIELDQDYSMSLDGDLLRQFRESLDRRVELESGAYLIIDQLEALTVIDVNTGGFTGSSSLRDTVLKTNLEAAREIARQIRLRDLGGIILVDFIDLRNKEDESRLLNSFRGYLNQDTNRARIIDITELGLVELTRRKKRKSTNFNHYKICPKCQGRGKIFIDI